MPGRSSAGQRAASRRQPAVAKQLLGPALMPRPAPPAGTIGHVAHGKSTVVKAITGVQTVRFKNELERNITIKLG